MKLFGTVGLALMLLTPLALAQQPQAHTAPKAEEKPVVAGYDIAACSQTDFYAVHFKTAGDDLNLVSYIDSPGEVNAAPEIIKYMFVKEDTAGRHYTAVVNASQIELTFKFEKHTAMGTLKREGKVTAVVFGIQADGTELSQNAAMFAKVCSGIREDSKPELEVPAPQTSHGEYDVPNNHFGRNESVKQI